MDYISNLPNDLIWKIYSCMPHRDVASTSALSKQWYGIWSIYASVYLKFEFDRYFSDTSNLAYAPIILKSQENRFLNMVNNFIQKRLGFETRHHKFQICVLHIAFHNMDALQGVLEDWIRLIFIRGIPNFALKLYVSRSSFFRLPILHSESIKSLSLRGCLIKNFNLVLPNLDIFVIRYCKFEKKTSLETLFQGLMRVKDVKISFCDKISQLHISDLPSLTNLEFLWCQDVDSVIIKATALRAFCFACQEQVKGSFRLDCNVLEELKLTGVNLTEEFSFGNLISTLPNLQILSLKACVGGLDFSCGSLTKLELQNVNFTGECNVVTPKFQILQSHYGPLYVPTCAPSNLKSTITFEVQTITNLRPNANLLVPKIFMERLIAWRDFLLHLTGQKDIRLVICLEYEDLYSRKVLKMENLSMQNLGNILQSLLQEITRVAASKQEMMDEKALEKISRNIMENCSFSLCISVSLRKLSELVEIRKLTSQD